MNLAVLHVTRRRLPPAQLSADCTSASLGSRGGAVQAERRWQDQLNAAVSGTEQQRQHTLAANRKIGTLEGALATAKEKHAAQMSTTADMERQIEALGNELRQVKSVKESLAGSAAQVQERVALLQDEIEEVKAAHDAAVAKLHNERDGMEEQVGDLHL